jgi:hypothetical protein
LPATWDEGFEKHPGTDVEGTHALGGVYLVADHAEQVDAKSAHVDRDLADGLGGVGVEERSVLAGDAGSSSMGCSTPVSLLAVMIDTRAVRGVIASARSCGFTRPSFPTGR